MRKDLKAKQGSLSPQKTYIAKLQVSIDPSVTILDRPKEFQQSSFIQSAAVARKERLKKIYEHVLYRNGEPSAQELYKQYFQENMNLEQIEKEIENRRTEAKILHMNPGNNTIASKQKPILNTKRLRSHASKQ